MTAVTVGGQAGAGGIEIGRIVANDIDGTYVQKQAIRRVARQLDASVEAIVRKELAYHSRWKRIGHRLEVWMTQMGRTWAGDPWGTPATMAIDLDATNQNTTRRELPGEISDDEYKTAVFENAVRYLEEGGNIVLAHRAGCLTLKDHPDAVHVGLFAPKARRIERVAWRYDLGTSDAEDWVETMDAARAAWFRELADTDPTDRSIYDLAVDVTEYDNDEDIAEQVAAAAKELSE